MEQNTDSLQQQDTNVSEDNESEDDGSSLSEDSESEGEDAYLSGNESGDEVEILDTLDEADGPFAAFAKYCSSIFKEKYGSRKRARNLRKDIINQQPTSFTKASDNEDEYDFNHTRRGLAVIINNVKYRAENEIHERKGSTKDANNLYRLFRHLGFDVKRYNDLTGNEMVLKLQMAASNTTYDHGQADCFACAILSHGSQEETFEPRKTQYNAMVRHDIVYGVDWKPVRTEYLLRIYNDECCPELQGKPRLFFIQACRGKKYDVAIPITTLKVKKKREIEKTNRKGADAKDAVSSESELEPESETESESKLKREQEYGAKPREEPIDQSPFLSTDLSVTKSTKTVPCREEVGEDEQTNVTGNDRAIELKEKKLKGTIENRGDLGLEQTTKEEASNRKTEGSEQTTKWEKEQKVDPKWMLSKDEKQNEQIGNGESEKDTSRLMSPPPKVSVGSTREEIAVSPPPIYKDFLLMYAAPPGFFAWRNKHKGGWLIQSMKKTMMTDNVAKVSFSRLLTQVCMNVAIYCESRNRKQELDKRKLVPCVMSMLTKDIYFRKK